MNQERFPLALQGKIESLLGRPLVAADAGMVADLAHFTEHDLDDMRKLAIGGNFLVVAYIRFRLQGDEAMGKIMSFYSSVVTERTPVAEWAGRYNPA